MTAKAFKVADLFCGAGGSSTGVSRAAERLGRGLHLTAVNHWERAIETHSANHPKAAHFCQSLADLNPTKAVPGGKLDLLVASPECTHHSVARGGKPINDQSRATAYCVHRWVAALDVKRVLIENVPEFQTWGPIGSDNKPLKSKRGQLFRAYIDTFKAMGYRVEWRVLNAADYGAYTSRRRLFIQCAKGKLPIRWPEPTHQPNPTPGLFETLPRWNPARAIINWKLRGSSIFGRKRPLSKNTLDRIAAGLKKFGGASAEPFLILLRGTNAGQVANSARPITDPLPTVTTSGAHLGLCQPFVMNASNSGDDNCRVKSIDDPLGTIHAGGGSFGIVEPFVMHTTHHGEGRVYETANPLPCITGANRGEQALVQPFLLPPEGVHRGNLPRSLDEPIQTITAGRGGGCLVEPFILSAGGPRVDPRPLSEPLNTVLTRDHMALCEPFITPYYGTGAPDSLDEPLASITTRDRFGICEPSDSPRLDILFRMLEPDELKLGTGFGPNYTIKGNKGEQVKQIGNAVEVNQAEALGMVMLGEAA